MTPFFDSRLETFAQNLAIGVPCKKSATRAGYGSTGARKRSQRCEVMDRVTEIRRRALWGGTADLAPVIDGLAKVAEAAEKLATAAGLKEARSALAEVGRLKRLLPSDETLDAADIEARWPSLTQEQWMAKYAPDA